MKKISIIVMALFYVVAGFNHFNNPAAYDKIIPPYFSNLHFINTSAGIAEIFLGILVLLPATRKPACYAIIGMLVAFIPAHIYMLKTGWCVKGFCFPQWALWVRLLLLQPLLIWWAFKNSSGRKTAGSLRA